MLKNNVNTLSIDDLVARRLANLEGSYASPFTGLLILGLSGGLLALFVAWMLTAGVTPYQAPEPVCGAADDFTDWAIECRTGAEIDLTGYPEEGQP